MLLKRRLATWCRHYSLDVTRFAVFDETKFNGFRAYDIGLMGYNRRFPDALA
jgi:hypothetical protein